MLAKPICGNWSGRNMAGNPARFLEEESGTTAVEYALIASLIAVALAIALTQYADSVNGFFSFVSSTFVNAVSTAG
jgi:pilus assembly protein Flp/PilA